MPKMNSKMVGLMKIQFSRDDDSKATQNGRDLVFHQTSTRKSDNSGATY